MRQVLVLSVVVLFAMLALTAATPTPASAYAPTSYYVVRYGDTMDSIAWRFGMSSWSIARANGVWNPNYIYVGQVLYIPCAGCYYPPSPCPNCWNPYPRPNPNPYPWPNPNPPYPGPSFHCSYRVQYGDTMGWIAARLGVSAWTLAQYNGIYNLNWIYAGQWLRIPNCYL